MLYIRDAPRTAGVLMADLFNVPETRSFYGRGLWLDRSSGKLSFEERCDQVRDFLRGHSIHVPDDYVKVFSYCHTAAELWFVYEVTRSSGWELQDERSLTNHVHRITIGARPTGYRIPVLIEDLSREPAFSVAVDIQPPRHYLPSYAIRDSVRRLEIARSVDHMVGIPDYLSRRKGKELHVDLMRQRLRLMGQSPPPARPVNGRFWIGGPLAYDVSQLPVAERMPILVDWLKAHNHLVSPALVDVLAHCERGGELLLLLQLLTLPRIEVSGNSITVGDLYRVTCQPLVLDWTVDFLIEPVRGQRVSYSRTVIEVEPARYFTRDVRGELFMAETLAKSRYKLERVTAETAKFVGRQWHQRIAWDVVTT
jgi:hypothetical protein